MGSRLFFILFFAYLCGVSAQGARYVNIIVKSDMKIAETDDQFVCATIDWWPPGKCNYNQCPWGQTGALYLNLSHPILVKAIQAFNHLRIRVGGSLQDQVVYNVGTLKYPCHPFRKMEYGLFGFSKGCLEMNRWDELNRLFSRTGAIVTFGLNALYGRHKIRREVWGGAWDSSNARDFIKYTISRGYHIDSWEFGNELSGSGVGASVGAEQYGKDMIKLDAIINELYNNSRSIPLLLAPGGFFDAKWYTKLLEVSGFKVINVVTHHLYNLGAGDDPRLVNKILDPYYLNRVSKTFQDLKQTIKSHGPWASAWVGESGGAYNSGGRHVSNSFVDSIWYLDQLGMASKYNTKVYCRQTLIGGNYGLLDTTTFVPNPDYYSALLWHRLMGKAVLAVDSTTSPYLRVYAHCSKGRAGVTLLLISLNNQTDFKVTVQNSINVNLHAGDNTQAEGSFMHRVKKTVSWVGSKTSDGVAAREEYHLTSNGNIRSRTMFLNGKPLQLTEAGDIPTLDPVLVDVRSPITMSPHSIAFISFPKFEAQACA